MPAWETPPPGRQANRLIDEYLTITSSGLGTGWTATVTWPFDPASDDSLEGNLDRVFQFESGSLLKTYTVTPSGTTLTIPGVISFSDWYAGNQPPPGEDTSVRHWELYW